MKVLVTGTGRCGTGYAAKWLTSRGIVCGHENVFCPLSTDKLFWGHWSADASWLAVPWLTAQRKSLDLCIHLVRDPRTCIPSLYSCGDRLWTSSGSMWGAYMDRHFICDIEDRFLRCCEFWLTWNLTIEMCGKPTVFLRLEDCANWDEQLAPHLDLKINESVPPLNVNTRPRTMEDVSWSSLPEQVCVLAESYGYGYGG